MRSRAEERIRPYTAGLDEALARVVRDTTAHIGAIYLLSPPGEVPGGVPGGVVDNGEQVLLMEAEIGMPGQIVKPWTRIRTNASAPVAAAVRRRRLIWVPDRQEMAARFPGSALALPYRFACVAVPLVEGARLWGALALLWPASRPAELATAEREAVEAAAHNMATLLGQAADSGHRLEPAEEPRVLPQGRALMPEPHAAMAGYLDRLRGACVALNLDGVITFADATGAALLGADVAELRGKPLWEVASWLKDPVFEDRCRAAVVSQELTWCTARHPDGRELRFWLYPDPSGISLRITPAAQDDPANAYPRDPSAGAAGMHRVDVYYNFLHMVAGLTRALNVREAVDLIADHVMPVFRAAAMAIIIAEGGRMRIVGSHGYPTDVLDRFDGLPLASPTPVAQVLRSGEPLFAGSWSELGELYPELNRDGPMQAWALLPLAVSDDIFGCCVLAFDHPHPFTAEQRATLTALAGMMGPALDRALVYDTKDRLSHTLQTSLLPGSLPEIAGLEVAARYVPATRGVGVGGDFYDLIRLDDTTAAAVIADVQGHNMTAAALMGQVRTAIHAHAATGAGPGDVLMHTNRLLLDLRADLFTSCLLVYVNLRLRTLCAANAGHLPPLLRPPSMPAEVIDVPPGVLLGIDPDADYPTVQTPFPPGAVLALYTDGLVESPGTDLDEAIGGLAAHLTRACDEPLEHLTDALLDHAPHTRHRADDIALMLLQHRGTGPQRTP
ncbi:SpoIIE family protein phosphatase [Nonomuraea maheshkhaliensis]|uniref:SpoIIE family protein phosphatase n=1 Tax=Nonomuraea maheshkhaliensis TaxID=419590 RepID=A0ABN2HSX3_9ACTN